ncbi:cGMP-dependent protein kinase 1-like [Homarus americanus]|uniref:cGMP-dependent protein kinase 1-like n=1 Tax=Homarus americanus TaxID=6706 RepID=UPI001C461CCD|nr:cGMP-dependent protein kinase 1-like [Homarus americanus]
MPQFMKDAEECIQKMGSVELQDLLNKKDDTIRHLEAKLKVKDNEIVELKSQLDKFQSVMPFATGAAAGNTKVRARKTRAQGISAEPQTLKTVQELANLSQTTFPEVPKSASWVNLGVSRSRTNDL